MSPVTAFMQANAAMVEGPDAASTGHNCLMLFIRHSCCAEDCCTHPKPVYTTGSFKMISPWPFDGMYIDALQLIPFCGLFHRPQVGRRDMRR